MAQFRIDGQQSRLVAWIAGAAFLFATNYCVCEALAGDPVPAEASHQHAPSGHHDNGAPSSDTQDDPCCSTLQAVVTPHTGVLLSGASQLFFQHVSLSVVDYASFTDLSLAPSGLSPPARAPTPSRPFYRTTFASHAPPLRPA